MKLNIRRSFIRSLAALVFSISILTGAQAQTADLVSILSDQLGISGETAASGAGAIFGYAKENLGADDFASMAENIPNMDSLLSAAPKAESNSTMSAIGGLLGSSDSSLGGLASLASSFETLNLDADMVNKFLPIVVDYVGSISGEQAGGMLKGLF